jgi:malate:Na+ symporter
MIINDAMTVQDQRTSKIILAIAAITILLATVADKMPSGMISALGIMVISGFILNYIGDRTPIINQFFGGGAIVVIFGSAYLFHSNIFSSSAEQNITTFMKSGGFLAFYVACFVTGSIFGMDTQTLKKAALKYIPVILGAAFFACILTGLVGMLVSKDFYDSVMLIALPIMGGGMGAGAVPLVEIMSGKTGMSSETLMSQMVPALAIGNAIAIIIAGVLNKLGQNAPSLTGNGQLIRGKNQSSTKTKIHHR